MTVFLIKPAFPAPFPTTGNFPAGPYLALEGGAIASAASPTGNAQPSISPNELVSPDGAILASVTPVSGLSLTKDGLVLYKVNDGDTVNNLAAKFGISSYTILWANHISKGVPLTVGHELIILPVSGVLYEVQSGDTANSISAAYKVSPSSIVPLIENGGLVQSGDMVVIENGVPKKSPPAGNSLPDLGNYLQSPVENGLNTGILDKNNGVDVSASCGAPVHASADGLVTEVGDPSQSNNGLGGYVQLSNTDDGIQTIYAHTASNEVSVGDFVTQGEEMAKAGNTGTINGMAGCDVYFEVIGAKNPLAN